MKRKTGNLRTTMRMVKGVELLPNDQEQNGESSHSCVQSVRNNIREDMEDRWVTNLSEDRKRFYLVSSLLDPHTKMLSFCDNKYFPSSWKDDGLGYLSMDLKSFYVSLLREK